MRPDLLRRCLESIAVSLKYLDLGTYEVLVSDDCPNQTALEAVNIYSFANWIQGPRRGVAANRNNIVNAAIGKWILFIDDDEIADENWLFHYNLAILSDRYDVIEGRVQPIDFPDSITWYAPCISSGGAYCTANLAFRRDLFYKLGGFNETFNVSHEDVEFGHRIRSSGCISLYLDSAVVFHPARRYSLLQVWNRIINLQCQSYFLHFKPPYKCTFNQLVSLLSFSIKYWLRITRFEFSARQGNHWRRQLEAMLLLLFSSPVALIKLLKIHMRG